MPRFPLFQTAMGIALAAIIFAFAQSEGWGTRFEMIETLSFSADDSWIAVTKLAGRDAETPWKFYKANVSRTVCRLNSVNGKLRDVVHQDFKPGNRGPAFGLWWVGRTSVLVNPSNDQLAMSEFGGGSVVFGIDTAKPLKVSLQFDACNIARSRTGRFLAASGRDLVAVIDTFSNTVAMEIQSDDSAFLGASLMDFTHDETRLVVAGSSGVDVWEIATSKQISTVIDGHEPNVYAISVASDNTLIVCSDNWIRRYTLAGKVVATLATRGAQLCDISDNGISVAAREDGELTIYDLRSNKQMKRFSLGGVSTLVLSSDGQMMAVGDFNGQVALIETTGGSRRWQVSPPSRYRWPWTVPAAFLLGWIYLAWQASKSPKSGKRDS